MKPEMTLLTESGDAQLICPPGFMRMVLSGALSDANLWASAGGASAETKARWAHRGAAIRSLLGVLPTPVNPRNPFEDLTDEPTPEEADARWRERAAAEDQRQAARVAAAVRQTAVASPADDLDELLG